MTIRTTFIPQISLIDSGRVLDDVKGDCWHFAFPPSWVDTQYFAHAFLIIQLEPDVVAWQPGWIANFPMRQPCRRSKEGFSTR